LANSNLSRRSFVHLSALNALALMACRKAPRKGAPLDVPSNRISGFGPLVANPSAVLELPQGFQCAVVQRFNETMTCGNRMPAQPDGMTCHMDSLGRYVLLRNHELSDAAWMKQARNQYPTDIYAENRRPSGAYSQEMYGGVSRVVMDPQRLVRGLKTGDAAGSVVSSNLVLTGTQFNCSGGSIEGGWISCEESDAPEHGYAFFTRTDDDRLVDAHSRRVTSWGCLKREGVSVEPRTGHVYMTEDHRDGSLYRFVPDNSDDPMGAGRLQALAIEGLTDTDPESPLTRGASWPVRWVAVGDPQAALKPCREQVQALGAARFNRCEGSVLVDGSLWFIASTAGPVGAGQIFRLDVENGVLHLEVQVDDRSVLSMPDNLTIAPWGDLLLAEDNYNAGGGATHQFIRGLTPDGAIYDFARNPVSFPGDCGAELSGPCFSPDGRVLFVNIQAPVGATVAIQGPWGRE